MGQADIQERQVIVRDEYGEHLIVATAGQSLLKIMQHNGVEVAAVCGGSMSCGTCHVRLSPEDYARIAPPTKGEIALLEGSDHYLEGRSRLACQISAAELPPGAILEVAPDE